MPKERERAREGRTQTRKHRESERERNIALSNPFLRSRTQKLSNPFITHRREPKNRQTHSPPIITNPEIVTPFVKPIRQTRDRPAESPICLLWVDPPLGRSHRRSACSL